jgi:ribosomal-protein-alanine acetyltransferase
VKKNIKYRIAKSEDVEKLVELENACFDYDALGSRNFRYFINKGNDDLVVQLLDKEIVGYGLLLYRKGTSLCRLYSIAVSPDHRGKSLGKNLMLKLEDYASARDSSYIRLEVKKSNTQACKLYDSIGYREFSVKHEYYEDHEDAICMEKKVQNITRKDNTLSVPFYKQTTEFTCGPSSLMMAMKSVDPKKKLTRTEEIQIWREATTIFMTSGHGGCGPHGLALSAYKRGFDVELYLNTKDLLFVSGVRQKHKKEIIKIVQEQFYLEIKENKIPVKYGKINWSKLTQIILHGGVPLVLISSYRLTETKTPHWIVITGINEDFVFFNDPDLDDEDETFDNINIPVRKDEFELMAKFGSSQIQSMLVLTSKRKSSE